MIIGSGEPSVTRYQPPGARARIGVARRDVTPPVGIRARNWGAARTDVSTGIHRPILANALCIQENDGTARYLVTLDLMGLHIAPDRSIRTRLLAALQLDKDRLLLHCVHTHAGPSVDVDEAGLDGGDLIAAYVEALIDGVTDACLAARSSVTECTITWGYGHCELAGNRDLPTPTRDLCGFNPALDADDTVAVGRVADSGGHVVAVLVNYACHATTLAWQNSLISPDFVGAARETVEEAVGGVCLFLQGASGELGPKRQYTGDVAIADANGRCIGNAALATLGAMPPPGSALAFVGAVESGAPLGMWEAVAADFDLTQAFARTDVVVPLKPEMSADEIASRWPSIDSVAAEERARRAQRLRAAYAGRDAAEHPVWVWRLGDGFLVAQPGEAYSLLQRELRRRHPDRVLLVMNLTNAPGAMYLPPAAAYDRDRYQVWQTLYERGALERVIECADGVISTLTPGRTATSV